MRSQPAARLDWDPVPLLTGLPPHCGVRLLEPRGPGGWAGGLHVLGLEPEAEFRGGLAALEEALRWLEPGRSPERWDRVLLGSLSYELGTELAPKIPVHTEPLPSPVDLAGFRALYLYDRRRGCGWIVGGDPDARARLAERLAEAASASPPCTRLAATRPLESLGPDAFRDGVERIRQWIRAGDVYQVNLARRLSFPGLDRTGARALYARLRGSGDAPFAAYLETPERTVLSNSPERFLRVRGREVETCPIKGTRPRGSTPRADAAEVRALLGSAKDAAEHVMIVDLERNDLGRVCEIGSVEVAQLAVLRSFASVHHLVSSVRGRLRPGVDALALLGATFPGGSITGAPKLRAMQIIAELEPVGRDVYTGALGLFDAAGDLDLSIAIRTAVLHGGMLHLHVGAGIVADSDAEAEWLETEVKAQAFRELWSPAP